MARSKSLALAAMVLTALALTAVPASAARTLQTAGHPLASLFGKGKGGGRQQAVAPYIIAPQQQPSYIVAPQPQYIVQQAPQYIVAAAPQPQIQYVPVPVPVPVPAPAPAKKHSDHPLKFVGQLLSHLGEDDK